MATPKLKCPKCDKLMVYDPNLSNKKKGIKTFWCTGCSIILTDKTFEVSKVKSSVVRYVFHGELP